MRNLSILTIKINKKVLHILITLNIMINFTNNKPNIMYWKIILKLYKHKLIYLKNTQLIIIKL